MSVISFPTKSGSLLQMSESRTGSTNKPKRTEVFLAPYFVRGAFVCRLIVQIVAPIFSKQ